MKVCSLEECDNKVRARGLCSKHYQRAVRKGEIVPAKQAKQYCTISGCNEPNHGNGLCAKHWARNQRWGSPHVVNPTSRPKEGNSNWKGQRISYSGAHRRVYRERGPATNYACHCGDHAQQWAYDHSCADELSEMTPGGIRFYSGDVSRYTPMCVPCHKEFDLYRNKAQRQLAPADVGAFLFPNN